MEGIKEIADQYKQKANGATQKELLFYCINKIDKIYDKLDKGVGKIADNRVEIEKVKQNGVTTRRILYGISIAIGLALTAFGATR